MLPLLLAGCDLIAPAPAPLVLSVGLPTASHAGSVPARDFLHLQPDAKPSDSEHEALCAWMRREATDDRIAEKLQARGDLGFSILEASGADIRLNGAVVQTLTDGVIPESERRSMMVSRLYDDLIDHIETRKTTDARCQIPLPERHALPMLIAIDPGVPFETVSQILYTAGQAQAGTFYMVVDGPAGAPLAAAPADEDRQLISTFQEDGSHHYSRIGPPRDEAPPSSITTAIPLLEGGPLGCGLVIPKQETRWSAVVSEFDALASEGASRFIIARCARHD